MRTEWALKIETLVLFKVYLTEEKKNKKKSILNKMFINATVLLKSHTA